MAGLEGAIKELFEQELKVLRDEQTKQDERCQTLEKACQDLSGKVVEREREAEKLREALEKCQQDLAASNEKAQGQITEDVTAMKERLNKFEDDADGMGGLKQVHEKIGNLERAMSENQPKLDEDIRLVKENTTRTEEFDRTLRELSRQCEEVTDALKVSEERLSSIEGTTATVNMSQQALEDSVTRKYEVLWEDVLHAIDEVKGGQVEVMRQDLASQQEAFKAETRSAVNYALNFMAAAHGERRQMNWSKKMVTAWREQTWIAARRRMGLAQLRMVVLHRQRNVFDVWHRRHDANALCDRLREQYNGQLSDVYKEVEDKTHHLKHKVHKVEHEVKELEQESATKKQLNASISQLRDMLKDELKAVVKINDTLTEHGLVHQRHDELHREHFDKESNLDTAISNAMQDILKVAETCKACAKSEEVQGMVRDILLIWNSIKQLDSAKADKKDVDCFALETGNRDKLSVRRLEDLEADFVSKSRHDTLHAQEKFTELEGRLDESGRQFRHWEQMWEKLSGFVEDLVAKIADLQGGDHHKGHHHDNSHSTLRMPGRPGSREGGLSRSRADIPTMPTSHGATSLDSTASTRPPTVDSKSLWLNCAKGVVDSSIDQAVKPPSARPHSRPKSASGRRPHDRAR